MFSAHWYYFDEYVNSGAHMPTPHVADHGPTWHVIEIVMNNTLRMGGTSSAARNLSAFSIWPRRRLQRSCKSSIVMPSVDVPDNASRMNSICSLLGNAVSFRCLQAVNQLSCTCFTRVCFAYQSKTCCYAQTYASECTLQTERDANQWAHCVILMNEREQKGVKNRCFHTLISSHLLFFKNSCQMQLCTKFIHLYIQ